MGPFVYHAADGLLQILIGILISKFSNTDTWFGLVAEFGCTVTMGKMLRCSEIGNGFKTCTNSSAS